MSVTSMLEMRSVGWHPRKVNADELAVLPGRCYQKNVLGHTGCVNALEFSQNEDFLVSGGDDMNVFLWSTADLMKDNSPHPRKIMDTRHESNIFAVKFSNSGARLFSGGNDRLFISHDVETGRKILCDQNAGVIHNIDIHPNMENEVAVTQTQCSCVTFIDTRTPQEPAAVIKAGNAEVAYSGQYCPSQPTLFALATESRGLLLYDIRHIKHELLDLGATSGRNGCMYARWSADGNGIVQIVPHGSPVFIDLVHNHLIRLRDERYQNHHTIKSVDFIGPRRIATGSDNFDIFVWDIPAIEDDKFVETGVKVFKTVSEASGVLRGHRSIVNQVRYSNTNRMLASSGVEKIVKLWSPLRLRGSFWKPRLRETTRIGLHHEELSDDSTAEDTDMLRYFDSLVLRNSAFHRRILSDMESAEEASIHGSILDEESEEGSSGERVGGDNEEEGESGDREEAESSSDTDSQGQQPQRGIFLLNGEIHVLDMSTSDESSTSIGTDNESEEEEGEEDSERINRRIAEWRAERERRKRIRKTDNGEEEERGSSEGEENGSSGEEERGKEEEDQSSPEESNSGESDSSRGALPSKDILMNAKAFHRSL